MREESVERALVDDVTATRPTRHIRLHLSSEVALLTADKDLEPFCSSFVALASHYLGGTAPSLPKTHLNGILAASRVLLRYLLNSLDAQNPNGTTTTTCSLSQVYFPD